MKLTLTTLIFLILSAASLHAQVTPGDLGNFITTWQTDNPGDSDDDQITIPTTSSGYNYDVYWEEVGNPSNNGTETGATGNLTIDFGAAGTYQVEISGDFPRIYFDNSGDKEKILTIEQWGDIEWGEMFNAFYGAVNLEINALDAPDLSSVTSMNRMFQGATSLNSDLNHWDVSTVIWMSRVFFGATAFNGNISSWDVSSANSMWGMFFGASGFDGDISEWDVDNVTDMTNMFRTADQFNQDISGWNVSNVTTMNSMFRAAEVFNQDLGEWNISNVTDMALMLNNTGLSTTNYDATLIGWAGQSVQSNVELGASGLEYCSAQAERQSLIDDDGWAITGDALALGCNQDPFITTWKTDNSGDSDVDQITIPTEGSGYNYDVYWEEVGNPSNNGTETGVTGDLTIDFGATGTYQVEITGVFSSIYFNDEGDKEKILTIEQWGDIEWENMENAFWGTSNLEINAADAPDLSGVTNMNRMFRGATSLNSNLNNWDVSGVTGMESLFQDATVFNGDISSWDVSGVLFMNHMFAGAGAFNADISGWDVSSVTTMQSMLNGTSLSTANYDATLTSWSAQTVQSNVELGADGLKYCASEADRQSLIDDDGWTISGDALALGCNQNPFITTWKTDNSGDSDVDQITIPTDGSGYNYDVYWEEVGNPSNNGTETGVTGDLTIDFGAVGTYRVEITGDFPRIYFINDGDKEKILTVEQWGDIEWENMENAFWGTSNLEINAADAPDLSGVTNMNRMFRGATSLNSDLNHWDVSAVTGMVGLFQDATVFNGDISSWDVSGVSSMWEMFREANAFNQDISGWDVSSVTSMEGMFWNASTFDQDIGLWNISNVTNMSAMLSSSGFSTANYDATLTGWAGQTVQNGVELGANGLEYCVSEADRQSLIDDDGWTITGDVLEAGCSPGSSAPFITTWKTDNSGTSNDDQITIPTTGIGTYNYDVYWEDVTDAAINGTETGVTGNHTITFPAIGTYRVEITGDFPQIFFGDTGDKQKILTIEQWGDNEWTSMGEAFNGASNLVLNATDAPDLSGVTSLTGMFRGASSLNADLKHWDVSNVTSMNKMFQEGSNFNGDISDWDVSGVTNMSSMFAGAEAFDGTIDGWNVGNTDVMFEMFSGAVAFNQDLSSWNVMSVINMEGMLDNSGLSVTNYDATLIGWAGQTVQNDVELGVNGLEYCAGETARQSLIDDDGWTITDDALASNCNPEAFITTWKTDNTGTSNNDQITIPTTGSGYNYDVDWGDGVINTSVTGDITHTYNSTGTYTIEIIGDFPRIYFNNSDDKDKILSVDQWGDIEWASMEAAFYGASNLIINAVDAPDLGGVISLANMFRNTSLMNTDLNHLDVSGVNTMAGIFLGASSFNGNIGSWDVSGVSNMNAMFNAATSFNQDISGWDVSSVTNMIAMFEGASAFNQNLGDWDVGDVTNMQSMLNSSGLSQSNYDNTLIDWEGQAVQNNVLLGASGLEYCNGEAARQSLIADDGWTVTGDALASGCNSPEGEDQRILAGNPGGHTFSGADFGITNPDFSIKIETLPGKGELLEDGIAVVAGTQVSVNVLNQDRLTWNPPAGDHGYNYTSFEFRIVDDNANESDDAYTMTIDLGAASVELTGGEGWRFLANPSVGDTYGGFLNPIWTKGVPGSDSPGASVPNIYTLDQPNYQWEEISAMSNTFSRGEAFIVYVFSDDNSDSTPEGFPKTLTSGENWQPLANEFSYSSLDYDPGQGPAGDSHYLIANPHPVSLDFCGFTSTNVANSVDIWDPSANGGNGDYVSLNCATGDVFIAPFQAFWIRTTDANPSLAIPESAYLDGSEEGYFKEPSKGSEPLEGFVVRLHLSDKDGAFTNKTTLLFSDDASEGLDEWDAPKLSPAGLAPRWLSFHSLDEDNRGYALQSLPSEALAKDGKITIPLDIQTTEAGAYTLEWSLPESNAFVGSYYLRDTRSGEVMELREGMNYRFEIGPGQTSKVSSKGIPVRDKTLEVSEVANKERSAMSPKDIADLGGDEPRFELLVAAAGIDGLTELGDVPEEFTLAQNYPNPFNPTTVISYELPQTEQVRLVVYDMVGRQVATLVSGQVAAGRHTVNFDASNLSSGVYLYRLQAGAASMTRKLTVVK